jgi:hypothetical protein
MFRRVDLSTRLGKSLGIVPGTPDGPACCHQLADKNLPHLGGKPRITQPPKPTSDQEVATIGRVQVRVRQGRTAHQLLRALGLRQNSHWTTHHGHNEGPPVNEHRQEAPYATKA